ncbi:MAG: NFACT family protein [Treponema sp.]|jgi:predicted ribosome quality control (RQC) complex YloA/Tae2 family protein|nr:NFACT family protein [Treponema sp.]
MSLNWKEINLILTELDLEGAQIQSAVQSAFDVVILRTHKKGQTRQLLVSLSPGACRIHETLAAAPKSEKPLRFAQFLNSRIVNGRIIEARQLGDNRIVRLLVNSAQTVFRLYLRLWSNAANFVVTDEEGCVLDAMRRLPKRGEITGGRYSPEEESEKNSSKKTGTYEVRELPGEGSFNRKIDQFYAVQGGPLSLDALREQARRSCEGSMGRISAALARLREKEASFTDAGRLKTYGDLILSNIGAIKPGDKWLETEDAGEAIRIELDPRAGAAAQAEKYYEQYRKAKTGLAELRQEIVDGERELKELNGKLERLLAETNPLVLAKLLKTSAPAARTKKEKARPGLSFRRGDWLIIVGRDASENDELLRRHVKGNDLWLHARDYHGSYVFIKQRSGKTVPLEILLDAATLAIFYSKGRNNGKGDLFYTQVKYLRRAKNGPKGLVIPTQEKNLHVKVDDKRLRVLESCRE